MPPPPRRVWRDWVLFALVAVLVVVEGVFTPDLVNPLLSTAVVLAVTPTLLWRRTQPLWMLCIVLLPIDIVLPVASLTTSLFLMVIVYALFRWASGRDLVIGSVLVLASLSLTFVRGGGLLELVGGFALLLMSVLLGMAFRYRAGARLRLLERIRDDNTAAYLPFDDPADLEEQIAADQRSRGSEDLLDPGAPKE